MPPAKKVTLNGLCQVCKVKEHKYRCPGCHAPYCSVPCFRTHKTTCGQQPTTAGPSQTLPSLAPPPDLPSSAGPSSSVPTPLFPLALPSSYRKEAAIPDALRSLASLKWPEEPDPGLFMDPLTRDDPKPLRREELMRIATSPTLRNILATNPALKPLLTTLSTITNPGKRSSALTRTLGLDEAVLSSVQAGKKADGFYLTEHGTTGIPAPQQGRGRGRGGRGRGRGGRGGGIVQPHRGFFVGDEEKDALKQFAEVVRVAVEGDGKDERRMEWEV